MSKTTQYPTGRRIAGIAGVFSAALILGACASTPQIEPTSSLDAARTAISNAEKNDAGHYAGAELDAARQKLQSANRAVSENNMMLADRRAQEARVEAELASARAESKKAEEVNIELIKAVDALTEELQRGGAVR
ncbi:MAG: DUF4398 domain-containing protein [Thioalkalivibrio sp.]